MKLKVRKIELGTFQDIRKIIKILFFKICKKKCLILFVLMEKFQVHCAKLEKKIGNWPLEIKFGVLEFLCVHDGETRQTQNETEIMTPFSLWIN